MSDSNSAAGNESPKPGEEKPIWMRKMQSIFGDGFILIALTAISYLSAFSFKKGFFSYYGIPEQYVSVDLDDCLRAAAAQLTWAAFAWIFIVTIENIFSEMPEKMSRLKAVFELFKILLLFVVLLFALTGEFALLVWGTFTVLLMCLIMPILAWIMRKVLMSKKRKKATSLRRSPEISSDQSIRKPRFQEAIHLILVALVIVGLLIPQGLGFKTARSLRHYGLIDGTSKAVITAYKDGFIIKEIDPTNGRMKSGFSLLTGEKAGLLEISPTIFSNGTHVDTAEAVGDPWEHLVNQARASLYIFDSTKSTPPASSGKATPQKSQPSTGLPSEK